VRPRRSTRFGSLLLDGKPAPVKVALTVKLGSLSLAAEIRKPGSRKE
jgi:hypothetical protein